MDNVVYQETMLCLKIVGHIYSWKIIKFSDFMFYRVEKHRHL